MTCISIIAIFFLSSCSDDNPTQPPNTNTSKDTSYVNVIWTPNTIQFTESDVFQNDDKYTTITFKETATNASKLKAGSIVFIYGKALKKVASVTSSSGKIQVQTTSCTLNEAISDGEISWKQNLKWTKELISSIRVDTKAPQVTKVTDTTFEVKFPMPNSLECEIKMNMKNEKLETSIEVTREINKFTKVKYSFEGYLQNMKNEGKIKFQNSQLREFKCTNSNIEGECTVGITAIASSSDLLGPIEIPFTLIKVPYIFYGIPVTLNLKLLLVINTKMASIDASAFLKTKFKYNSIAGITYDGTDVGVTASAGPYNFDYLKDSNWVATSVAAGINFGIAFPRLELDIFDETVVPYIQTAFLVGGSFTAGVKTCLTVDASFIGAVGFNFNFFGLAKGSGTKNLWQYDKNIKKIGDCN
jgi:hypothetical protein